MENENAIQEIWRIREEIGAEHGFDMDRLFAAMREKEKQYGARLVRFVSRLAPEEPVPSLGEEPPKAG